MWHRLPEGYGNPSMPAPVGNLFLMLMRLPPLGILPLILPIRKPFGWVPVRPTTAIVSPGETAFINQPTAALPLKTRAYNQRNKSVEYPSTPLTAKRFVLVLLVTFGAIQAKGACSKRKMVGLPGKKRPMAYPMTEKQAVLIWYGTAKIQRSFTPDFTID